MAPRIWKKPLTLMYDHNYRYGSSLYSGAIDDIERRYLHSMSRTHLPSDRPDLLLSSYGHSFGSASTSSVKASLSAANSVIADHYQSSLISTPTLDNVMDFGTASGLRRARSVPDMPTYMYDLPSRYHSRALIADPFNLEEQSRARRRRRRRAAEDYMPLHLPTIPEFSSTSSLPTRHRERPSLAVSTDVAYLVDKCRQLQQDLEGVSHRVAEAEGKLKAEAAGAKSKIQQGLSELGVELEQSGRQNSELQKVIKRQAKQMGEMQSLYDDMHRHLNDAGEELTNSQRRCHGLQSELDSIKHALDQHRLKESSYR